MDCEGWLETVPTRVMAEACWKFRAYPEALYFYELVWNDCEKLQRDVRGRAVVRQLIRSAGSISANYSSPKSVVTTANSDTSILYSQFSQFSTWSQR
jgi:hypothetical protein